MIIYKKDKAMGQPPEIYADQDNVALNTTRVMSLEHLAMPVMPKPAVKKLVKERMKELKKFYTLSAEMKRANLAVLKKQEALNEQSRQMYAKPAVQPSYGESNLIAPESSRASLSKEDILKAQIAQIQAALANKKCGCNHEE